MHFLLIKHLQTYFFKYLMRRLHPCFHVFHFTAFPGAFRRLFLLSWHRRSISGKSETGGWNVRYVV